MAHNDCLQDVPDIFENAIGESLNARSEGLGLIRELGPPDLCHIVKVHSSNRSEPDIGSYHHVLGVDTSSSASLAAYINSLQYSLNETPGWFGSNNSWKIASGTYCSYNVFSNVDLRVQVKIPGGVDAYIVTAQGERKEASEQMWKECNVSALLRAILYSDPTTYTVTGLRRLTPVANSREETRFVEAIVEQFWSGWALGSNAETQVASNARNFLVDGLMCYFAQANRFDDCAAEILAPLAYSPLGGQRNSIGSATDFKGVDPEVASLLADAYIECDEEVQAVRVMHQALKVKPSCYPLLYSQAEFLRRKKQLDSALTIVRMAVKYAPSEFQAWAKLTEIYIEKKDFHRALLTLNTCPMYTFVDRDYPRVPTPRRINFPVKSDILVDYNLGETISNDPHSRGPMPSNSRASLEAESPGLIEEMALNENSILLKLSAPTLKGTFARAYEYLTDMVSVVGWDDLLQLRSQAFVMEDEYRNSAHPNPAVDDEEDDDDRLPLATLRDREIDENTPLAAIHDQQSEANAGDAEDGAPEIADENTAGKAEPEEATPASENAEASTQPEAPAQDKDGDAGATAIEPKETEPKAEEPNSLNAEADEDEDEPKESESQAQAEASKGKKKNKKRKNKKKSKENLKEQEDEQTPAEATKDDEPSAETAAGASPAEEAAHENETTNGDASTGINALADQLDEVALSDNTAEQAEPTNTAEEDPESKPNDIPGEAGTDSNSDPAQAVDNEAVSTPQAAVFSGNDQAESAETTDHQHQNQQPETENEDADDGAANIRKRLCERWLDNLIMILFDDLRAYTAWRSEMHNLRATGQQVTFRHTQAEWEALGDLALRLHHPSEAKEAYEYALNIRFSAKAWQRLLELYSGSFSEMQKEEYLRSEELPEPISLTSSDSLMAALDAVVWLTVYHDRWYNGMSYPNPVCEQVIKLVRIHGLSKVRNSVVSMNLKPPVFKMVAKYFAIVETFEVEGTNW
ncbi:chaps-domain-containing protein [Martensiomyces pterosporus]|nr:chaps-domain-containing protein [Martensiomyces pterosporus]